MTELVVLHAKVFGLALLVFSLLLSAGFGFFCGIRTFAALRSGVRYQIAGAAGSVAYAIFSGFFFFLWVGAGSALASDLGAGKALDLLQFSADPYIWPIAVPIFLLGAAALLAVCGMPQAYVLSQPGHVLAALLRRLRFAAIALGCLMLLLILARIPTLREGRASENAVVAIHGARIMLAEVMERDLTAASGSAGNTTIAGIDANHNGVRDDVELAIFAGHPDSARIRAAEFQYAKALQALLAEVFDSQTLIAASQEASRAYYCLSDALPKPGDGEKNWSAHDASVRALQKEVDDCQLNTPERRQAREAIFEKYMASHGDIGGADCDVDLTVLPN